MIDATTTLQTLLDYGLIDGKYKSIVSATLAKKNIVTVCDILNMQDATKYYGIGIAKVRKILDLQEDIKQIMDGNFEQAETNYNHSIGQESCCGFGTVENAFLPRNCSEDTPIADMIKMFVSEFYDCAMNNNNVRNSRIRINKILSIKLRYLDGLSKDAIVRDNSITVTSAESVRQIIKRFVVSVGKIVSGDEKELNEFKRIYGASYFSNFHPQFISKIRAVGEFLEKCPTDKQLANFLGCCADAPQVTFALDCFSKIKCDNIREELRENFITSVEANKLEDGIGVVFDLLDEVVRPYHENELRSYISRKTRANKVVVDTICKILDSSSQFEKIDDGYQLKWQDLKSAQTRVERILYENKQRMEYKDIQSEYRRRCDVAKMKQPRAEIKIVRSKKIYSIQQGYWIWGKESEQNSINIKQSIKSFLAEKELSSLNSVYDYVKELNVDVNERSVKSYVTQFSYETEDGRYLYKLCRNKYKHIKLYIPAEQLLEEVLKVMPQGEKFYTVGEIEVLHREKYGALAGKKPLYMVFYRNKDFFETSRQSFGRGTPVLFRLKSNFKEILQRKNAVVRNVRRKTDHTQRVINEAINTLQGCADFSMLLKDLVNSLKPAWPKDKPSNQIYKVLGGDQNFVKEGNTIRLNPKYYSPTIVNVNESNSEQCEETVVVEKGHIRKLSEEDFNEMKNSVSENLKQYLKWIKRDGMEIPDFDKAWSRLLEISGVLEESVRGSFQRTFRHLYNYLFGSTTIDDRFHLYDELNRRYEEFLSKILNNNDSGLVDLINEAQDICILPKKEVVCNISKYITNLINFRNKVAHKEGEIPPDSYMINAINQALTLYLYTAVNVGANK